MIAVFVAFVVGFALRLRGMRAFVAWLLSCCVSPAHVLFFEFVVPYKGASFWQMGLIVGGMLGAISGGLGVTMASFFSKNKEGWFSKWLRKLSMLGDDDRLR